MEWWLLTFFISAILSLFIPIVPEFSLLLAILLVSLFLIAINKYRTFAIALFALSWILIAGSQYQHTFDKNKISIKQLHLKEHVIQGEVINIVSTKSGSSRFNFLISHWQGWPVDETFKVRLTWKVPSKALLQGQKWQLTVKLKPAHGLANVGGFNYQVWLLQQKIVATGYVKANLVNKTLIKAKQRNILLSEQISWRQHLYQKLKLVLADSTLSPLILALGFGERGELTREHWQVLSATATQHLIAISGLHIGIVAFASLLVIRAIIRLLPLSTLLTKHWQLKLMRMNFRYLPIFCSCFMAWYYAYLAGFSIPTLRALVMLLLFWSLKLMNINVNLLRWLLIAVVIILMIWPLSLLSASFWLSISALVIIFSTFTRFTMIGTEINTDENKPPLSLNEKPPVKIKNSTWWDFSAFKSKILLWVKTLVIMQLALTMAMLPIAASLNYQLPLAAFFANVVAVPVMSVTVIPLSLLAVISLPFSTWLAQFFSEIALLSLSFVWQWLTYLAEANWAVVAISYQQIQVLLLFFILIAFALFFRFSKVRFMAVLGLLLTAMTVEHFSVQQTKDWQLSVLDVGHGLAIVIEKNRHVFIYDTGASYPSGFNMADAALIPYLKHQGYQSIDGVIISHNDNDHAGGLPHLRSKINIKRIIANEETLNPDGHCISGQRFTWQGLTFDMLSPMQINGDKNDDSCVVTISDGFNRVLLPGDISRKQERRLLNVVGMKDKLASDLLIAPHHGSKSSSSPQFLKAVAPLYVVFSTGYLNRWKMPSEEILARYSAFELSTFNTAELGMITFKFSQTIRDEVAAPNGETTSKNNSVNNIEGTIEVINYRGDTRPYWFVN
ncbi:MAG: DNA internalization-related competence protein ComEC/Rec2 [Cognaticolwellia sp.]